MIKAIIVWGKWTEYVLEMTARSFRDWLG